MNRLYTNPVAMRFSAAQHAWLQAEAKRMGHGQKIVVLRRLIDNAMRRNAHQQGRRHHDSL